MPSCTFLQVDGQSDLKIDASDIPYFPPQMYGLKEAIWAWHKESICSSVPWSIGRVALTGYSRNFWAYLIELCKLACLERANRAAWMHGLSSHFKLLMENLDLPINLWYFGSAPISILKLNNISLNC